MILIFSFFSVPALSSAVGLPIAGDHRVSCQEQPIKAVKGGELIIECQVSPTVNLSNRTVDVKRTDLEPVSGPGYVHVCRRQHDSPDDQMPQYSNRTFLLHENLSRGIVTLRIFPVQLFDQGRYRVHILRLNFSFVDVIVVNEDQQNQRKTEDSSTTGPPVEDDHDAAKTELLRNFAIGSVCAVAVAVAAVVFILVKRRRIRAGAGPSSETGAERPSDDDGGVCEGGEARWRRRDDTGGDSGGRVDVVSLLITNENQGGGDAEHPTRIDGGGPAEDGLGKQGVRDEVMDEV